MVRTGGAAGARRGARVLSLAVDLANEPAWSYPVVLPTAEGEERKVTVREELTRGRRLYLWWRDAGNWRKQALGKVLRDARGQIDPEVQRWAILQATAKCQQLTGTPDEALPPGYATAPADVQRPLTVGETEALLTEPEKGAYKHDTPHRRELLRSLAFAADVWGKDTAWSAIGKPELMQLAVRKLQALTRRGKTGIRSAEIVVGHVLRIAAVLKDAERIPPGCVVPRSDWREQIRVDWQEMTKAHRVPEPARPRHTLEEMRALLRVADDVDPRFGLLMALGAELRLGQVRRSRRSDLDLARATLHVHGRGKKGGTVVELTPGQVIAAQRALTGLLAPLEAKYQTDGTDYPLFPAGHLLGRKHRTNWRFGKGVDTTRPVSREWIHENFHEAERRAEITPVPGRAGYGVRRVAVDAVLAEEISTRGLQAHGGWSSPKIPTEIYADQENRAGRAEAALVRAKIRGEAPLEPGDDPIPAPTDRTDGEEPTR